MLSSIHNDFSVNPLDCYYTLDVNQTRLATFDSLTGGDIEINIIKHNVVYSSGESSTLLIPAQHNFPLSSLNRALETRKSSITGLWMPAVENTLPPERMLQSR